MVVYVDKKGRLAALDGTTMLHIEDTDVDVKFHLELKGGSYLTQNMSGTIEMEGDGDVVTLEVQRSGKYDKKNLTDELSLSMDTGDDTFGFSYAAAYTVDDGAYDVSAKLSSNGSRILGLSAEGAVDELEKGKSFHMDIDKLKLTIEDSEYITFKGEYYLRPLEDEIDQQGFPVGFKIILPHGEIQKLGFPRLQKSIDEKQRHHIVIYLICHGFLTSSEYLV